MSSIVANTPAQREALLKDFGRPERAGLYVPRILQQHLADDPLRQAWIAEGTAVFADVSGFTKLSEALSRKGREGAEQITETIEQIFSKMLGVAYERGGSLLKFGGDALLLWFDGEHHVARACSAAWGMHQALRDVGAIELHDVSITLRMSQGVHTGHFEFFAVGKSHRELLPVGPAWSRLAAIEGSAEADQIVVSAETAALLPAGCQGDAVAMGHVLAREPAGHAEKVPLVPGPKLATETLARCLSPAIRSQVLAAEAGRSTDRLRSRSSGFPEPTRSSPSAAQAKPPKSCTSSSAQSRRPRKNRMSHFSRPTWTRTAASSSWPREHPRRRATTKSACSSPCARSSPASCRCRSASARIAERFSQATSVLRTGGPTRSWAMP
jgi:Adenylate cyclase, family 3 (some proteins contain HAMP domain)